MYVCDTDVTSGFASESTSKLDSLDSRIRIRIRQIEYGLMLPTPVRCARDGAGLCGQTRFSLLLQWRVPNGLLPCG